MKPKLRIVKRWDWSDWMQEWQDWYHVEQFEPPLWPMKPRWRNKAKLVSLDGARLYCAKRLKEYRMSKNPETRVDEILWQSK